MKKRILSKALAVLFSALILTNSVVVSALEVETNDTPQKDTQVVSWEDKIQPYLLEVMEKTEDNEKIPVWLWMEDIDEDEVEKEVYARTSLKEDNLSVISEPISDELAVEIAGISEADSQTQKEVSEEFREYLKSTENERKLEAQRVDTYIHELRQVQKEMYTENNAKIFKTFDIPEKDLIFTETQAPVYILYLSKKDIQRLAENSKVTSIYYYEIDANDEIQNDVSQDNRFPNVINASSISKITNKVNLTGNGVALGIIDVGQIITDSEVSADRIVYLDEKAASYSEHARNVSTIAAGTHGIAPNSTIYSSSRNLDADITVQSDAGVNVVNYSKGSIRENDIDYTGYEKYVDFYVLNKRMTVVCSAGNEASVICKPAMAYNVITVGGYFNQSTSNYDDDVMDGISNYDNRNGCSKPDLIADELFMPSTDEYNQTVYFPGTSYAATFVTGTVALLFELCPVLKTQPEAVKAILMSSCHRKVTPSDGDPVETMSSGITNHQGAGAIDPYIAIAIAASNNYGVRTLEENATSESIRFVQPKYSSTGLNVSLAWSVNNPNTSTAGDKIRLQLTLIRNDLPIAGSNLSNSSTQMVYVTPSATQKNYTIQINKHGLNVEQKRIRYAYAFSVNKCKYEKTNKNKAAEGIFLLKNKSTGKYLTISDGTLSQNSYSTGNSQYWVLCDDRVASVSEDNCKLNIGSTINSVNKRVTLGSSGSQAKIVRVADTAVTSGGNTSYYPKGTFCIVNNGYALANYDDSQVSWRTYNSSNVLEEQEWYLESVAYQRGDVDMDGTIDAADALLILRYSVQLESFTNVQKYLGDVNGDGTIDSEDALIVNRIMVGLDW